MKKVLTFVSLFLLLVFQTTVGQYIKIFNVLPDFILTFAIVYSVSNMAFKSAVTGLVSGLLLDFTLVHSPYGISALIMMYTCTVVSNLSGKFYYESIPVSLCFVFGATVGYEFIYLLLTKGIFSEVSMVYALWRYIVPEAILNTIICLPLRLWVRWLKNEYIRGI